MYVIFTFRPFLDAIDIVYVASPCSLLLDGAEVEGYVGFGTRISQTVFGTGGETGAHDSVSDQSRVIDSEQPEH